MGAAALPIDGDLVKKGNKKIVWRCISRLDHGTKYCKESPTIEEEQLHTAVLHAINNMMSKRDQLVNIIKTNLAVTLSGQDSDELNPLIIENRIKELESLTLELLDIVYKEKMPQPMRISSEQSQRKSRP